MRSLTDRLAALEEHFISRCRACRSLPGYVVRVGVGPHTDPWSELGGKVCGCGFETTIVHYILVSAPS